MPPLYKSFDPSVMLNWIWKPSMSTTLNTAVAFRHNAYRRSSFDWYQAADPRPNYYRNLPSYYLPTATYNPDDPYSYESQLYLAQQEQYDYMVNLWRNDESVRQIDWNSIYQTNLLNREYFDRDPSLRGQSSYILKDEHQNQTVWMLNSYLNHRISDILTLQGGVNLNYTDAHYFQTVKDLLGGEFWRDVDNFSERDFAGDVNIMQNDMRNPNRKVGKGDVFGYDYNIHNYHGRLWIQNQINTQHFNVNYALEYNLISFMRHGNMQNGRAPENSYGNGKTHTFNTGALKAGVTYKIDGRNYITAHFGLGNRAPLPYDAYVSPRTKDDAVKNLETEKYISADLSYTWNYKNFRGSLTGFITHNWDGLKRSNFYDYQANSFMNYAISGMETEYKGIELGMEYKILSNLSVTFAGTYARYQYKNNPMGIRSYENGAEADIEKRLYYKNYRIGGTPQQVYSIGVNYNIKQWFFEANAQWFGDTWFEISPARHEEMPDLWKFCSSEADYISRRDAIAYQDKLNSEWVVNLSVGKLIYTKFGSLNFNLSVNNLLNNRNIQTGGWQEGKFDYTNYDVNKFPNKIWYAQGIRVFFNVGIRF